MKQVPDFEQLVVRGIYDSLDRNGRLPLDQESHALIISVGHLMAGALRKGNRIIYFGNGRSAADAPYLGAGFSAIVPWTCFPMQKPISSRMSFPRT